MSSPITVDDLNCTVRPDLPPQADNWDRHWVDFSAASELSPATRYRRRLALRLFSKDRHDTSVRMLEIGSGMGQFAGEFLAQTPQAQFLGLELSRSGVDMASCRVPAARFVQRDLLAAATQRDVTDFRATQALCSDVLEHLDDPRLLLRNAAEYMAPGCKLVVTVPGGWYNAFYRHIGHRRHYTPAQLSGLLESAGFTVERAYASGFPFFNIYRMLITLRGQALISDAAQEPSLLMRALGATFDALFHLNLMHPWGWQTVAVARYRGL
ncbi:MAG: class I SAM-dependent methyltransferase [Bryobacteraceae bacterium]|jgi:SAM-dependent methyltransferase